MDLDEDRVYDRHRRRHGAVLIVGTGAVGGVLAVALAKLGYALVLVDRDVLDVENLIRHPLGAKALGQNKATALAEYIRSDKAPWCDARGIDADFLKLPEEEQRRLASQADVVVAAADRVDCQMRVNDVCIATERLAVYPAIWVDPRVRDGEVGEILWVIPGGHTPCYACAMQWRQAGADTEARGGTGPDMEVVALATAWVVAGLLEPDDARSAILAQPRTLMYVHGFMPTSPAVERLLPGGFRTAEVPFPEEPCPACRGHRRMRRSAQRSAATTRRPPQPVAAPVVSFRVSATHLRATVDTSGTRPESNVRFIIDWGDGSERTTRRQHTYERQSNYRVTVTATNAAGSASRTQIVRATEPPPPAPLLRFWVETRYLRATAITSGTTPQAVVFRFSWGDGSPPTAARSHTYARPGTYTVTATATNSRACFKCGEAL